LELLGAQVFLEELKLLTPTEHLITLQGLQKCLLQEEVARAIPGIQAIQDVAETRAPLGDQEAEVAVVMQLCFFGAAVFPAIMAMAQFLEAQVLRGQVLMLALGALAAVLEMQVVQAPQVTQVVQATQVVQVTLEPHLQP
jgi:hypothetical protein